MSQLEYQTFKSPETDGITTGDLRLVRRSFIEDNFHLSSSTIRKMIAEGTFPRPIVVNERCVRWVYQEVLTWANSLIEKRDNKNQASL